MVEIRLVDCDNKKQVKEFVQFHYDLYKGDPNWVPPFRGDVEVMLNKKKHPYYEHSEADFFTAWKDGKMVGRIAVLNNRKYNEYHHENGSDIFLFDSIDDQEVANALFDKAAEWSRERGLDKMMGPKGFGLFDGYGVLVEGFDVRQVMNMSCYNYPYYQKLYETYGWTRINEFVSMSFNVDEFNLPEKAYKVADIVKKRGTIKMKIYKSRKEIMEDAHNIAAMYFKSFQDNWEYFPMSDSEFDFFVENVLKMVDPKLIRILANDDNEPIGLLVNFPDLSAAMQRHHGTLTPALIIDLLLEMKKADNACLNGIGVLPEYHKRGGTALLYTEMKEVFNQNPQFKTVECVQMADSAAQIRQEMENLGLKINKRHRVYQVSI